MRGGHNFIDITGTRFGRLVAIKKGESKVDERTGRKRTVWICQCDCGKMASVQKTTLMNYHTKSCGCIKEEKGMNYSDLTGKKFNLLLVIRRSGSKNGRVHWECLCDCGNVSSVATGHLKSGHTRSCGCLLKEAYKNGRKHKTHGLSKSTGYGVWVGMMNRCNNPKNSAYHNYGGRGIKVCEKWLNFEGFLEDMLDSYVEGLTLERINNEKGYSKDNCKWANSYEQSRNKRNTVFVEAFGKREKVVELCERYGVRKTMFNERVKNGWSVEDAILKPKKSQGTKGAN